MSDNWWSFFKIKNKFKTFRFTKLSFFKVCCHGSNPLNDWLIFCAWHSRCNTSAIYHCTILSRRKHLNYPIAFILANLRRRRQAKKKRKEKILRSDVLINRSNKLNDSFEQIKDSFVRMNKSFERITS